jgi:hypothetical protein
MVYLLSFVLPVPSAVLVATVSRLEIVSGEIAWVLVLELLKKIAACQALKSSK